MDFVIRLGLVTLIFLSVNVNSSTVSKQASITETIVAVGKKIPGTEGIGGTGLKDIKPGACDELQQCRSYVEEKPRKQADLIKCIKQCVVVSKSTN